MDHYTMGRSGSQVFIQTLNEPCSSVTLLKSIVSITSNEDVAEQGNDLTTNLLREFFHPQKLFELISSHIGFFEIISDRSNH